MNSFENEAKKWTFAVLEHGEPIEQHLNECDGLNAVAHKHSISKR